MGTVVLDTSVLLGALDPQDLMHGAARQAILDRRKAGHTFAIPTSVLTESLVGASRLGEDTARRAEAAIDILVSVVMPLDREIARAAAAVRAAAPGIRLPDAIVMATGRALGATAVLTGDKRWLGVDPRVELVHPG
jgi:predicted nucleic acid-binding protein